MSSVNTNYIFISDQCLIKLIRKFLFTLEGVSLEKFSKIEINNVCRCRINSV